MTTRGRQQDSWVAFADLPPEVQAELERQGLTWLPPDLLDSYMEGYIDGGTNTTAIRAMRQDPAYSTYFPGNLDPNGEARYDEGIYYALVEDYKMTVQEAGLDPDTFTAEQYGQLIANDKSAAEFQSQVTAVTAGVLTRSEEVRAYYAQQFGINVTDADMILSVMAPDMGEARLAEKINIAQIGGAAGESGFTVDFNLADELENIGVNYAQAQQIFQQAGIDLPVLERLSRRHQDPNDTFDLVDYLDVAAFARVDALRDYANMISAERTMFRTNTQGFSDRTGSLSGLIDR